MAFVERHGLPIWQLQQLLDFEGFGGVDVPYIGYTQLQLKIRGIKDYDKDILVFIQKDSKYSEQVPIVLGTLHIKDVIQSATKEELVKLGCTIPVPVIVLYLYAMSIVPSFTSRV